MKSAWDEYFSCLSRILVFSKRDPGVERLVQFVALAAGSDVEGEGTELDGSYGFAAHCGGLAP